MDKLIYFCWLIIGMDGMQVIILGGKITCNELLHFVLFSPRIIGLQKQLKNICFVA